MRGKNLIHEHSDGLTSLFRLIKQVNKNQKTKSRGASTAAKKAKAGRVMQVTQSVPRYNTSLKSGNAFDTNIKTVEGKKALVVTGSSILLEVNAPKIPVDKDQVIPLGNLPLHPFFFNCPRLLNIFTSYIRWKLLKLRVKYIPRCPTTASGEVVMGFSSCIQDGGPDGTYQNLKSVIVDLPGSVVCQVGQVSPVCESPFLKSLDWKFTCRDGMNLNAIYCGLFSAAIEGNFFQTPDRKSVV